MTLLAMGAARLNPAELPGLRATRHRREVRRARGAGVSIPLNYRAFVRRPHRGHPPRARCLVSIPLNYRAFVRLLPMIRVALVHLRSQSR